MSANRWPGQGCPARESEGADRSRGGPFPASLARRKGLTLALLRRMKDDVYERGIRLAETGRVDLTSLVTARFPLEQADEAVRVAASRRGLKVVIQPPA